MQLGFHKGLLAFRKWYAINMLCKHMEVCLYCDRFHCLSSHSSGRTKHSESTDLFYYIITFLPLILFEHVI
jgi:hypothetical protein